MLAGSPLTITCDIYVDEQVNTPISVDVEWTMSYDVLVSNERVTVGDVYQIGFNEYRSVVDFSTLSSTYDSGNYNCTVNITSNCMSVLDANVAVDYTFLDVVGELILILLQKH